MSEVSGPIQGRLLGVAAGIAVFLAAIKFPDLDAPLGLHHRSAVTHSILIPFIIWWCVGFALKQLHYKALLPERWRKIIPDQSIRRAVSALLFLGLAIHLAADCVPKNWVGRALVYFPGPTQNSTFGFLNAGLSAVWLATNAAFACAWCHRILTPDGLFARWAYQAAAFGLLFAYAYLVDANQHLAIWKATAGLVIGALGYLIYKNAWRRRIDPALTVPLPLEKIEPSCERAGSSQRSS